MYVRNYAVKKLINLMVYFLMVFGLFGCSNNNVELLAEIERLKVENESLRQGNDMSMIEGEGGELTSDASNEPMLDVIVDKELWEVNYYVDEFKQPTKKGYISNKDVIEGTFSNSATTDSKLYVKLLIDKDNIDIMLYEYGSQLVKNSSSRLSATYIITMKTADDKKHEIKGTMSPGGDRIRVDKNSKILIPFYLKNDGILSFFIVEEGRRTSTYLFTIEKSNYVDAYELLE